MGRMVTFLVATGLFMIGSLKAAKAQEYDGLLSPYVEVSSMPGPRWYMEAHAHSDYIYCFVGQCSTAESCLEYAVWRYDPSSDVWDVVDTSTFGGWATYSSLIGDDVYFAGGGIQAGWFKDSVFRYNIVTQQIDTLANLPEPLTTGRAFNDNGMFHLLGGHNGYHPYDANYIYDPESDSWAVGISLPDGLERYGLAKIDSLVYLLGGRGLGGYPASNINLVYNTITKTFDFLSALPVAVRDMGCAVIDKKIYLFGGRTSNPVFVDIVQVYDPATDTWQMGPSLPFQWAFMAAVQVDGAVYLMGGITEDLGLPIDKVYKFSPYISGVVMISPNTMYAFQAYSIDTIMAVIYFGDFTDGHTVDDIDPASLNINSTITPTSWNTLPSYPGFVGKVMEITFSIRDFILGYGPLWDTTIQVYTVSGEFNGKCGFSIDGEVTMFGHTSGDVNADGAVNIGDLTYLVDFLFNGGAEPPIPETADLDHSGAVNVADVTELVRVLF